MAEIKQQEIVTLKGRLKMKVVFKTSETSGDEYYYVPMEISEMEKNGQKIENQFDSIMLIF
jgi:Mor family transcriptional regulator